MSFLKLSSNFGFHLIYLLWKQKCKENNENEKNVKQDKKVLKKRKIDSEKVEFLGNGCSIYVAKM